MFNRRFVNIFSLIIFSAVLLLIPGKCGWTQSVYVSNNSWVYEFLERMETKHIITRCLNGTKPLSREEIAEYLVQITDNVRQGTKLNPVETEQLHYLIYEYQEEFSRLKKGSIPEYRSRLQQLKENRCVQKILPGFIYSNGRNFLSWQDEDIRFYLDPVFRYQVRSVRTDSANQNAEAYHFTNGITSYGYLTKHLGFFFDFRDNKEWGTQKYRIGNYTLPGLGFVRATSPDYIYHDETQAYLKTGFKNFQFVFGKFKNRWGPGRTGSLIFSDYATSYDQFKLEFNHKYFKFTSIYAFLIDYEFHRIDSLQQKKYLAGHRLEFAPWHWITFGLSETVVFKGRSFEPGYLNPVMFYRSAEHYLGSPDNMMMGLDFEFTAVRNVKLYGELLIDDLTTGKLGSNWYGNKLGVLGGIFFADFVRLDNLDLNVEYVRIRPFVYSHERWCEYTHYDTNLGHHSGPNSELWSCDFAYRPHFRWRVGLRYQVLRRGENPAGENVGGSIFDHFQEGDDPYPKFLAGNRTNEHQLSLAVSYEVLRNLVFNLRVERLWHPKNVSEGKEKKTNAFAVLFSAGINY